MIAHIDRCFVSPAHNFFGHFGRAASAHATNEAALLECLAGRGIAGDRFLDYRPDYPGQITFFEGEVFDALCRAFGLVEASPAGLRRNVVTRGLDLAALIDRTFCLQGVWFRGACECKPSFWMDRVYAPGVETWLRGRGGLRARILSDGPLRPGPAAFAPAAPAYAAS